MKAEPNSLMNCVGFIKEKGVKSVLQNIFKVFGLRNLRDKGVIKSYKKG